MVEYEGWEMPVEFSGVTEEHLAVRHRAGLFDVSHMGEIEVAGGDALPTVQWLTTRDASGLEIGQSQYSALTTPEGTFVDDVVVSRLGADHYLFVVNASSIVKDCSWISSHARARGGDVAVVNSSSRHAMLALQGPASATILQRLTAIELDALRPFRFATGEVASIRATVSRTGYTGEDGFEIFVPPAQSTRLWDTLLNAGQEAGIVPCGLAARDTLRLEASLRLSGTDMDATTTVLETGLGWIVDWDKGDFIGRPRLEQQKGEGLSRRLVAFKMTDRGIARRGHRVMREGSPVGQVTSGTFTPFLKAAVGFAMVPIDMAGEGTGLEIDIRGKTARAEVARQPLYRRT